MRALQFEPTDEGNEVADMLSEAGYDVTYKANSDVTGADFSDFSKYAFVAVVAHGDDSDAGTAPMLATNVNYTEDFEAALKAGSVVLYGSKMALTPSWFSSNVSGFNKTVVYFGACR